LAQKKRKHGTFHYLPEIYQTVLVEIFDAAGHLRDHLAKNEEVCKQFGARNGLYPQRLSCAPCEKSEDENRKMGPMLRCSADNMYTVWGWGKFNGPGNGGGSLHY